MRVPVCEYCRKVIIALQAPCEVLAIATRNPSVQTSVKVRLEFCSNNCENEWFGVH